MSTLNETKAGDTVAMFLPNYGRAGPQQILHKAMVARTTKNAVVVGNSAYMRSTGYIRRDSFATSSSCIEPWTAEHDVLLAEQEKQAVLRALQTHLLNTDWRQIDEDKFRRILAILDEGNQRED